MNETYSNAIVARCKGRGADEHVWSVETVLRRYSRNITNRPLCRPDIHFHFFKSNLRAAASSLRLAASTLG
jgi:hypothetical protein